MSERRLAAILFSDIAGYTSLMGKDEKKAFDILRKNRRIHWRLIRKYKGRWLKEMGDGILASFSSSINAVMCAISIQKAAVELEIPIRIGIHQGDVIFEKKDVLGDGVNIASRIQGIADTNWIVISDTVRKDIKNKEGLDILFLDNKILKGIDDPVGIYKVSCTNPVILDYQLDTGELVRPLGGGRIPVIGGIFLITLLAYAGYHFLLKPADNLSEPDNAVLVLPFDNYTGTDTLDYFVAGMHDALIGDIGKIGALRVLGTTTARTYKNTSKSIPEIARERGVNTIIESSVLCLGDSVCLRVKALNAYPEEKQIWVHDFKVEKSEILNLYNMVTRDIAVINGVLTPQQEKLLAYARLVDNKAYDYYMKGRFYLNKFTPDNLDSALKYFELAKTADPNYSLAYTGICDVWAYRQQWGLVTPAEGNSISMEAVMKAYALDSNNAVVQYSLAHKKTWGMYDWKGGESGFKRSILLNPNNSMTHTVYSHLLSILGRHEEALEQIEMGLRLDPVNPFILTFYAVDLMMVKKYDEAIKVFKNALSLEPGYPFALTILWHAYYLTGKTEEAYATLKSLWSWDPESVKTLEQGYLKDGIMGAFVSMADRLGGLWTEDRGQFFAPFDIALFYSAGQKPDQAMYWLEQAYTFRDPNLPYLIFPLFDHVRDDPRFKDLCQKMKLPCAG